MRIRSIKPEFWSSEDIAVLPWTARLTFIGLWSYVDDNGVGRDNERLIAADVYPLEEDARETLAQVSRDLRILAERGRIVRYYADGRYFLSIVNWGRHQRIDHPNRPRYPGPDAAEQPPTCENAEPSGTLLQLSRDSRETLAPGTGEQGNRGTDKDSSEVPPTRRKRAPKDEPAGFREWYAAYPKHTGRIAAVKAYRTALTQTSSDKLLAGATRFTRHVQAVGVESKFVPHPATWLNAGRWDDELPTAGRPDIVRQQPLEYRPPGFDDGYIDDAPDGAA